MAPNIALTILAAVMLGACSVAPDDGMRVLAGMGYTDIEIGGHSWWGGCGEDDTLSATFTATGVNGKPVSGVLCSGMGWFAKGITVRID